MNPGKNPKHGTFTERVFRGNPERRVASFSYVSDFGFLNQAVPYFSVIVGNRINLETCIGLGKELLIWKQQLETWEVRIAA